MPENPTLPTLAALLAWQRDMGADDAIGEAPIDWLARGETSPGQAFNIARAPVRQASTPSIPSPARTMPSPQPLNPRTGQPSAAFQPPAPRGPRQFPAATGDAALMSARTAAGQARSLEELRATLTGFDGCALKATAKNLCFYRGVARSRLMLIGEAPGRDEDIQGKPFVGRAGQLLDKMLAAIGLSEADVHITNIVYWRPPGNRTPTPQEAQVCRPFLERQLELVAPDLVLLLGGAAAKEILAATDGIMRLRGKWRDVTLGARKVRALATLHPAYLLRTPAAKRLVWRDLLAVKAALED
ncbi:MAG: uracil-DNA glycosylase [Hyphomicrobiaceae bacterium]|nr:uracil-DNA glycosylase [Hyphomicrobiaceae bacterium]